MKQMWSVKSPLPGVTACRRFTLVELLVTIAIIAILASMLAPALNSARNKARTIQCVSNIRNVNTALISYADSYDGFVPGVTSNDNSPDGTGKKMGWSSLLLYEGHIRNGRELTCPEVLSRECYCVRDAYSMTTGKAEFFLENSGNDLWHMAYGGYGMNYFVQGGRNLHPARTYPRVRLSGIRQPSRKLAVADTRGNDIGGKPSGSYVLAPASSSGGVATGGTLYNWHQNTANVMFFDGHVASFQGPSGSPEQFRLWSRSQKAFAYSNTQSVDESGWWMK